MSVVYDSTWLWDSKRKILIHISCLLVAFFHVYFAFLVGKALVSHSSDS